MNRIQPVLPKAKPEGPTDSLGDSLGRSRAGIEPIIGHLKHDDHRMVRNFLIRGIPLEQTILHILNTEMASAQRKNQNFCHQPFKLTF